MQSTIVWTIAGWPWRTQSTARAPATAYKETTFPHVTPSGESHVPLEQHSTYGVKELQQSSKRLSAAFFKDGQLIEPLQQPGIMSSDKEENPDTTPTGLSKWIIRSFVKISDLRNVEFSGAPYILSKCASKDGWIKTNENNCSVVASFHAAVKLQLAFTSV